nr:reverse transcriptase domain-containing protein [Sinorhizobium terangae]
MRSGAYRPSPARRKLIPKAGKPGQFRPLGIPTIRDRVVQGAVKILLEPSSRRNSGMSPTGSGPDGARMVPWSISDGPPCRKSATGIPRRSRMPYPWVIEGDIKRCFDNISHHHLLERLRKRIADRRLVKLVGRCAVGGAVPPHRCGHPSGWDTLTVARQHRA